MCSCGCDLWIELASAAARSECARLKTDGAAALEGQSDDVVGPTVCATRGTPEIGLFLKVVGKCFDWLAGPEAAKLAKARS